MNVQTILIFVESFLLKRFFLSFPFVETESRPSHHYYPSQTTRLHHRKQQQTRSKTKCKSNVFEEYDFETKQFE
jgi:hypothetical protein